MLPQIQAHLRATLPDVPCITASLPAPALQDTMTGGDKL